MSSVYGRVLTARKSVVDRSNSLAIAAATFTPVRESPNEDVKSGAIRRRCLWPAVLIAAVDPLSEKPLPDVIVRLPVSVLGVQGASYERPGHGVADRPWRIPRRTPPGTVCGGREDLE